MMVWGLVPRLLCMAVGSGSRGVLWWRVVLFPMPLVSHTWDSHVWRWWASSLPLCALEPLLVFLCVSLDMPLPCAGLPIPCCVHVRHPVCHLALAQALHSLFPFLCVSCSPAAHAAVPDAFAALLPSVALSLPADS
jgi:hypothetical protein